MVLRKGSPTLSRSSGRMRGACRSVCPVRSSHAVKEGPDVGALCYGATARLGVIDAGFIRCRDGCRVVCATYQSSTLSLTGRRIYDLFDHSFVTLRFARDCCNGKQLMYLSKVNSERTCHVALGFILRAVPTASKMKTP